MTSLRPASPTRIVFVRVLLSMYFRSFQRRRRCAASVRPSTSRGSDGGGEVELASPRSSFVCSRGVVAVRLVRLRRVLAPVGSTPSAPSAPPRLGCVTYEPQRVFAGGWSFGQPPDR